MSWSLDLHACRICLVKIEVDDMTFDFEECGASSAADIQELVLLYPVYGEDPVAPFRKAWSVSGCSVSDFALYLENISLHLII